MTNTLRNIDIQDPTTLEIANLELHTATNHAFLTPYIALERVRKVLSYFNIPLPGYKFMEGERGNNIFDVKQFGEKAGITDDGQIITTPDSGLFLYFEYATTDDGVYTVFAEIVKEEDLNDLLDAYDNEDELEDDDDGEESLDEGAPRVSYNTNPDPVRGHSTSIRFNQRGSAVGRAEVRGGGARPVAKAVVQDAGKVAAKTAAAEAETFGSKILGGAAKLAPKALGLLSRVAGPVGVAMATSDALFGDGLGKDDEVKVGDPAFAKAMAKQKADMEKQSKTSPIATPIIKPIGDPVPELASNKSNAPAVHPSSIALGTALATNAATNTSVRPKTNPKRDNNKKQNRQNRELGPPPPTTPKPLPTIDNIPRQYHGLPVNIPVNESLQNRETSMADALESNSTSKVSIFAAKAVGLGSEKDRENFLAARRNPSDKSTPSVNNPAMKKAPEVIKSRSGDTDDDPLENRRENEMASGRALKEAATEAQRRSINGSWQKTFKQRKALADKALADKEKEKKDQPKTVKEETLHELSKELLARYRAKADKSLSRAVTKGDKKTIKKRLVGLKLATKKYFGEASSDLGDHVLSTYRKKALKTLMPGRADLMLSPEKDKKRVEYHNKATRILKDRDNAAYLAKKINE